MSVLIKGIEMPGSCNACPFHKLWPWDNEVQCLVNRELWNDNSGRHKLCPLVPIPPHGRLIDADALISRIYDAAKQQPEIADLYEDEADDMIAWLKTTPTIIEAEGGERE